MSGTVKGMEMTDYTQVHELAPVDIDLLEHRKHLPETESCICGYVRPMVVASTLAA